MPTHANITPAIVEALYNEALALADEARTAFDLAGIPPPFDPPTRTANLVQSCEALRTTTRMMHALAWLLNHRAHFAGELTEFQLRRHGRLPPPQPESGPDQMAQCEPPVREIIERTRAFYRRVGRLDEAWHNRYEMQPPAVTRLRMRLGSAYASG